jgi:cold shock CspA family protein
MREDGVFISWFTSKGYGWIQQFVSGETKSFFAHISQIGNGIPQVGDKVKFQSSEGKKGPFAKNIEIVGRSV